MKIFASSWSVLSGQEVRGTGSEERRREGEGGEKGEKAEVSPTV